MIPMLLLISFIVYFGLQLTGIDPINFMVSPEMLSSNNVRSTETVSWIK